MKKQFNFLFVVMMSVVPLGFLSSCSNDEAEDIHESSQSGNSATVDPDVDDESLPFIGEWKGMGPYWASGTPSGSYGVVSGTWIFYNDGTYYWKGYNSYNYSYTERGKWHYNAENSLLITDGSCGLVWQIVDMSDGQWTGTLMTKGGTYTYKKTTAETHVGDILVIDYGKNKLVVQDTLFSAKLSNQSYRFGVCYGDKDNLVPETYTRVYADSLETSSNIFKIQLNGLKAGKYRLRGFIENKDKTVKFGNEYRAVCITPANNYVFLGEPKKYMWVWFYAKSALNLSGEYVEEGCYGDKFEVDKVVKQLTAWDIEIMDSEAANFLKSLTAKIQYDDNFKKHVYIKGKNNDNELILPYYDSSYNNTWYYTSMRHNDEYNMFSFNKYGKFISEYRNDDTAYVLPVYRATVRWNN